MESDRASLVRLVQRIMASDYPDEASHDAALQEFDSAVLHPAVSDLIYYPDTHFDHEPTAEEIVDRALSYKAIAL